MLTILTIPQTLAVDLLNPSAASEARRHKLKRLVQSPNSYFMDVKCPGVLPIDHCSAKDKCTDVIALRLLCHHHSFLPRTNRRSLWCMYECALPAYWW
jgi:hypothetical protein